MKASERKDTTYFEYTAVCRLHSDDVINNCNMTMVNFVLVPDHWTTEPLVCCLHPESCDI